MKVQDLGNFELSRMGYGLLYFEESLAFPKCHISEDFFLSYKQYPDKILCSAAFHLGESLMLAKVYVYLFPV